MRGFEGKRRAWSVSSPGVVALLVFLSLGPVPEAAAQSSHGARIKAALVANFLLFTDPLDEAGETRSSTRDLVILGAHEDDPDFASLEGKQIGELTLHIRRADSVEDLPACDLLFISRSLDGDLEETLAKLDRPGILTVSELEDFCRAGGAIRVFESRGRLAFEVSVDAVSRAELRISSRMLRIAKLYDSGKLDE